jgi:hypothetical protein
VQPLHVLPVFSAGWYLLRVPGIFSVTCQHGDKRYSLSSPQLDPALSLTGIGSTRLGMLLASPSGSANGNASSCAYRAQMYKLVKWVIPMRC